MQTLRQIVSDISSSLRATNLDDRYSFRYLASTFRDRVAYFLRLDGRSREFVKELGTWKPINCVELEDVAVTACGDIGSCYSLKRSNIQLPEAFNTSYGSMLKVLTLDGLKELALLQNSTQYIDYTTREYPTGKIPCFIQDKRIYIPNTDLEAVKVLMLAKDPIEVDKLNNCCTPCTSPLDAELTYSDYLITLAKKEVVAELGAGKAIVEDEKGDDNTNRK